MTFDNVNTAQNRSIERSKRNDEQSLSGYRMGFFAARRQKQKAFPVETTNYNSRSTPKHYIQDNNSTKYQFTSDPQRKKLGTAELSLGIQTAQLLESGVLNFKNIKDHI